MKVFIRYIRKNMLERKGRLFLLVFSIMLTCGLMIASMGLIDTITDSFTSSQKIVAAGKDIAISSNTNDIFIKESSINKKGIKNLEGEIDLTGVIEEKDKLLYTSLKGKKEYKGKLIKGAFANSNNAECVISERIANEKNLKVGDTLSLRINGDDINFKVSGIAVTDNIFYNDSNSSFVIVVPYEFLNKLVNANDGYTTILAEFEKDNLSDKQMRKELEKFNDNNTKVLASSLVNTDYGDTSQIQILLYIMLAIVCIISILIIRGVFKLIIAERMQTIGTFMSQGATKSKIKYLLILEAALYGCIGSVFGTGLGIGLLFIINRLISPNAKYGIYNPFHINPVHIVIGIIFATVLAIFSSSSAVRKIKKLQVKEVILNRVENHEKTGIITNLVTNFLCKIFKGNTTAFLAINNIKTSKLLRNNIKLLTISLSAVVCVVSASSSMVKIVMGAYEDLSYSYDIENIIDSSSERSTTDRIIEELTKDKNVDKNSINPIYNYMGEINNTSVVVSGVDPLPYKKWIGKYVDFSEKGTDKQYEKFAASNDDVMILSTSMAKKINKKIGDTVTLSIDQKNVDFKIMLLADYKLFNGGTVCVIRSEKIREYFGIREASTITYTTDNKGAALDSKYQKLAKKYGATVLSRDEEMDRNIEANKQMMMLFKAFAYIALGLSAIGIFNNITICFMQRTKEFAVMNSIGMNKGMRIKLILFENLLCVIWSIILSIPCAILCNKGMEAVLKALDMAMKINLDYMAILLYGIIIVFIVMIASLSAIRKSNKLNLIAELKYE